MASKRFEVIIAGDHKGLSSALDQSESRLGKFGHAAANVGKAVALGLAGAAVGAAALGKQMYDAAIESQKVTRQTEAVIKSMGNAANVSADDVAKLSTALSNKSAIDDELIQGGANVLLTFGKVRNEVGQGNDIFNRATEAALNMSVALGQDMNSASIMLGKALNDPIKGITAMTRAGVSFTEQQKDQIRTMVEAGDILGAQKIIIAEMEKQFGGSAEAQATGLEKLKVQWGNLQEQLGERLIPVVEKVVAWLSQHLPGAMASVEAFLNEWGPRVVAVFEAVVGWVRDNWPQIQKTVVTVVQNIWSMVQPVILALQALWENFGNNILTFMQRVWPNIYQVISGALDAIRGVIQVVTALIRGDWSAAWDGIKNILSGVWNVIQGIVKGGLEALYGIIGVAGEIIGSMFKALWNKVVEITKDAVRAVLNQIDRMLGPIDEVIGKIGSIGGKIAGGAGGVVKGIGGLLGFDSGGVVPGPIGAARLVVAHGGETILPTHRGGGYGMTVIIEQKFEAGADMSEAGRRTVEAIREYERRNGTGWRG